MLFDRRAKPSLGRQARNLIWPRSGWRRAWRYLVHRVRRIPGSPYAIAAGFACGAAISMTPLPGFHFVLAALIAWVIGGSVVASAIGTAMGNPWTFPLIWLWIFKLGNWILGSGSTLGAHEITLSYLLENPLEIFLPMIVGSIPTAFAIWLTFFLMIRQMVRSYQRHRRKRLAAGALADDVAGGAR